MFLLFNLLVSAAADFMETLHKLFMALFVTALQACHNPATPTAASLPETSSAAESERIAR